MRNYITLNGKNSNEINGLLIQELPPISKPQIRTEVEEIDGRDGDIVTKLGFAAYDKEFTVGLYKDFDINAIIAYFNSEGTVVFSNEPDKYYNYQIIDQIDFERLVRYRTATVRMHCQPFKYSNTEGARTLGNKGTASGEGSFITLDNTPEAQFSKIEPKGNAKQDGTPTPDSPQTISVVTGENVVKIEGKNLFDKDATMFPINGATSSPLSSGLRVANPAGATYCAVAYKLFRTADHIGQTLTAQVDISPSSTNTPAIRFLLLDENYGNRQQVGTGTSIPGHRTISYTIAGTDSERPYIGIVLYANAGGTATPNLYVDYANLQIELGSTATAYEPYQGQEFEVNLGKNLFSGFATLATSSTFADGTLTMTTSATNTSNDFAVQGSTAYYLNFDTPNQTRIYIREYDASGTMLVNTTKYVPYGFTTNANTKIVRVYFAPSTSEAFPVMVKDIQLEQSATPTAYAPYFTPIGLAAIPGTDYKDKPIKIGDKWYIEKQVGKVVFDGSETWTITSNGNSFFRTMLDATLMPDRNTIAYAVSNYYTAETYDRVTATTPVIDYGLSLSDSTNRINIRNKDIASVADFQTWLSTHPTIVYYALATPTTTEITNETLISQLEALYNQAHAYKGRTHVAAIAQSGNAPHIIEAEVQRSSDGNITNNGNIVSKPTLTIYGSGNIGVSLNGYQIFEITLGDEEYITIDTAAMEAYKDTLDNLKNRLVNGDYSKFALRPGSNMIEFSGIVSKCVISKYSRWL